MSAHITYSELVSILLKQLNKFRTNPPGLLPTLQKQLQKYQDKFYLYGGNQNIKIITQQGTAPIKQIINILNKTQKLPKLNWSYQLHCIANSRAKLLARSQQFQINKINQQSLYDLIPDNIECLGQISQHFLYGYYDPVDIISNLLIDDGHPQRQNRKSLLSRQPNHIGIGIQQHPKYMFVVVFVMVGKIVPKQQHTHKPTHIPFKNYYNRQITNIPLQHMHENDEYEGNTCNCQIF